MVPPVEGVRTGGQLHANSFLCVNDSYNDSTILSTSLSVLHAFISSEEKAEKESVLKVVGGIVMSCYAKYWILVCGGMFIMVSFAGKLVGYKIIYMLMFLICLCLYQVRVFRTYTVCAIFTFDKQTIPSKLISIAGRAEP